MFLYNNVENMNMYLEQGTRVGEFKNAKMGYNGLIDRLITDGLSLNPKPELAEHGQSD